MLLRPAAGYDPAPFDAGRLDRVDPGEFPDSVDRGGHQHTAVQAGTRPVQKHKRTQDWRAGPFRSSSLRGEPQIWGVSAAMSAIRVLRTRRENNVQQGDATLPGGDLDPGPGPHLDQNVLAGYATVALASILDPSGGLFSDAARPGQCPFSYWAQTWHSKIAIRDESQK